MEGLPVQEDTVSRLLLRAAKEANTEMVLCLVKKYEHENIHPEIFKWAVTSFSIPIMKALLERSPRMVNCIYHYLGTPLMIACIGRAPLAFVRFLLESGADANLVPATVDYTAIQIAATAYRDLGQCIEIIELLVRFGATMDGDVLAWAANEGRIQVMHYLLIMGVTHERDPIQMRRVRPQQQLALHAATQGGHCSVVLEFLLSSVDVNCKNGRNLTAMTLAQGARRNRTIVEFLLGFWELRKRNYDFAKILV
jgi:ankyrin repeat protein